MRFLLALTLLLAATAHARTPLPKEAPLGAPTVAPPLQTPTAVAHFVLDLDSGRVLEAKNPHARLFPASTTKIMTCLVALEHGSLNQVIRAGNQAATTGESGIGLLEGENHTLRELIEATLVHSANDACVAIAEGVGGSQARFVGWMNQKARQLGCRDTHFVNPHGLHDPRHFTSAHDLALIGRAALQKPFLNQVVQMKSATIGGNWKIGPTRVMLNRNKLLFRWNQCDGLKTGYTKQAGNCLVASATQIDSVTGKRWRLLAVTLKSVPGHSFSDCQWLLQRAFAGFRRQLVERGGQVVARESIRGGAAKLQAATRHDLLLPLRGFERASLRRRVRLWPLAAPLRAGARVGNVEYWAAPDASGVGTSHRIAVVPLVARAAVPQTVFARAAAPLGDRLDAAPRGTRFLLLGLLCCGATGLFLLQRRISHARRRPQLAFQTARLEPRNGAPSRPKSPPRRG